MGICEELTAWNTKGLKYKGGTGKRGGGEMRAGMTLEGSGTLEQKPQYVLSCGTCKFSWYQNRVVRHPKGLGQAGEAAQACFLGLLQKLMHSEPSPREVSWLNHVGGTAREMLGRTGKQQAGKGHETRRRGQTGLNLRTGWDLRGADQGERATG